MGFITIFHHLGEYVWNFLQPQNQSNQTHLIHLWYIYLHVQIKINHVNVGKYTVCAMDPSWLSHPPRSPILLDPVRSQWKTRLRHHLGLAAQLSSDQLGSWWSIPWTMKRTLGCLWQKRWWKTTQVDIGSIMKHYKNYKDPYETIGRMACREGFERCWDGFWVFSGAFSFSQYSQAL